MNKHLISVGACPAYKQALGNCAGLAGVSILDSVMLMPTSTAVLNIQNVKNHTAAGLDKLKPEPIICVSSTTCFALCHTITLKTGIFLDNLKKCPVCPVHKGGEVNNPQNY